MEEKTISGDAFILREKIIEVIKREGCECEGNQSKNIA